MERLFKLDHSKWKVADGIRVIKKHDLEKLIQASEIIDASQKEAAKIKEQAKIDYQKRFEEGLLQGQEEGKAEYTFKIMETVLSSVDSLEGLERQLVDVVVQSVSKIIGEIPQDERIIRIVRKGLNAVLEGDIRFNDREYDEFGWSIGQRVKAGVLRCGSVGFRVDEVEFIEGQNRECDLIYRKQELLEFSIFLCKPSG